MLLSTSFPLPLQLMFTVNRVIILNILIFNYRDPLALADTVLFIHHHYLLSLYSHLRFARHAHQTHCRISIRPLLQLLIMQALVWNGRRARRNPWKVSRRTEDNGTAS
jgi:hypothetical protein